jgi:hypothetical protein
MKKWFNTNYHYIVPQIDDDTKIELTGTKPVDEFLEAKAQGVDTKVVITGPFTFLKLAVFTGYAYIGLDYFCCGNSAETDYDFRADDRKLPAQPRDTGILFLFLGVTVLRGTAFYYVRDIDILMPVEIYRGKVFIEKYSCLSDKRFSAQILLFAGTLADKHDLSIRSANAEDDIMSATAEITVFTQTTFLHQLIYF